MVKAVRQSWVAVGNDSDRVKCGVVVIVVWIG